MSNSSTRSLWDSPSGYGSISRALHWSMALLFLCQFVGAVLHAVNRDWSISSLLWSIHRDCGLLLLGLMLLRGLWGFTNIRRRPRHSGLVGRLATLGHLGLYALMFFVPALALMRHIGAARPLTFFGLPVLPGGGEQVQWMVNLGNSLHSTAGWVLLAMIVGHVAMVAVHHFAWRDGTAYLMIRGRGRAVN